MGVIEWFPYEGRMVCPKAGCDGTAWPHHSKRDEKEDDGTYIHYYRCERCGNVFRKD